MIKPRRLKIGDTLGLLAPASPIAKEKVELGMQKLLEMGFKVKVGKTAYSNHGYLAGDDKQRAGELIDFFRDETIDGIICLRGGYGTLRILDFLDYDLIRKNPKVFVGYSDITALHIAFNQLSNLVTFHGPMVASDMSEDFSHFSQESLLNSILNEEFNPALKNASKEIITINPGIVEGPLVGGNLSILVSTLGTPYEIDTKGKILFIEEIGEYTYKIDRMITQLILSNKFKDVNGIILGDFNNCLPKEDGDFTLEELVDNLIKPLNKPTVSNLQAGHCEPVVTLPLGVIARLDGSAGKITILDDPIQRDII